MNKTDLADVDVSSGADDIDLHVRGVIALVKPCKEPRVLDYNGQKNQCLVERKRMIGYTMSVLPIFLVDSRMPDESWAATVDDKDVRSKRRTARRGTEGADGEGSVPRTANVCASVSKLSSYDQIVVSSS